MVETCFPLFLYCELPYAWLASSSSNSSFHFSTPGRICSWHKFRREHTQSSQKLGKPQNIKQKCPCNRIKKKKKRLFKSCSLHYSMPDEEHIHQNKMTKETEVLMILVSDGSPTFKTQTVMAHSQTLHNAPPWELFNPFRWFSSGFPCLLLW